LRCWETSAAIGIGQIYHAAALLASSARRLQPYFAGADCNGPGLTFNKQPLIRFSVQREDTVFRALADPSRRAIFERLTRGEAAVKDLTARFDISQPAVSQHLARLRSAGLVAERREGRLVYYRVAPNGLRPLVDWVAQHRRFWMDRLDRLQALLKEMDE
jgi:DNA-binding transcriptional ArsR family regulator